MTIKNKLIQMLKNNGMFESQAEEVMKIAEPILKKLVENYSLNLEEDTKNFPEVITKVLYLSVKPIALIWIEENKPLAWFKPMFQ